MRVCELRVTYLARADLPAIDGRRTFQTARDIADLVRPVLDSEPIEVFLVVCLTTKLRFIGFHEVSRGTLDSTLVHPREVLKPAILANAAGMVLAHNHPSGDPTPSPEDLVLTRRLRDAGDLLGIQVFDHVIIGEEGRYASLKEQGIL